MSSKMDVKKQARLDKKKRKAQAFLQIAELNDADRQAKRTRHGDPNGSELTSQDVVPADTEKKPKLEGLDFQELKQRLRERKKTLKNNPLFRLKTVGEEALIRKESSEKRTPLFMSDLQSLLTYCLCGDKAPYYPHRWCTLEKWNRLSNIVCVIIEGLGVADIESEDNKLKWITSNLNMMEVVSPASYDSSVVEDVMLLPVSARQRHLLIEEYGSLEIAMEKNEAFKTVKACFPVKETKNKNAVSESSLNSMTNCLKMRLLLNVRQLIFENYPLLLEGLMKERYKDYMLTQDEYIEAHPESPLFSVDCEMCLTEHGMELTRVCVVNEALEVVYHTFVKPDNPIINYLTQYSGITEELLENVTTKLSDVQQKLRTILPPDAILVGQSLNSDLMALKMIHPYIIDTSVIYNITGDRRKKTKLSILAHLFLNAEIQTAGKKGHNPEEDAKAAMNLVLLKLEKGYKYGDVLLGGEVPNMHTVEDIVSQEENNQPENTLVSTIPQSAAKQEKTVAAVVSASCSQVYDRFEIFKNNLKSFTTGDTYKEVLTEAKHAALHHNLTIVHLDLNEEPAKLHSRADKAVKELYEHTSQHGLFVGLLAGSSATNAAAGVMLRKAV